MHFFRPILFSLALAGAPVLNGCAQAAELAAQNPDAAPRAASTGTDDAAKRISGEILPPFSDDSTWANVKVAYSTPRENGKAFQRMQISELESGRAQLKLLLPEAQSGQIYTLEMRVRGTAELPFVFGVRDAGAPYKFHWQNNATIGSEWQTVRSTFTLPENVGPIGFWFYISGTGTLDIADFKLSSDSRAEFEARLRAQNAGVQNANLSPVSRFPLGLQSGSWLRAQGDAPSVESQPVAVADPQQIAPSGSPALRVESGQNYNLHLPPFRVPLPFEPHVASLNLKGKGEITLVVLGDDTVLTRKTIQLSPNWKRENLVFTPELTRTNYALRIDGGAGTVWLDGVQVEIGKEPTPLKARPEVALRASSPNLPQNALVNVQFWDERADVEWNVSGAPAGAVLKTTVFDLYGDSKALPNVKLNRANADGKVNFNAFPTRKLGSFRIEAQVVDAAGKTLSPIREIVVHRVRRPRFWGKDAPNSPFGTHMHATEQNIAMAKAIGLNWTRLHDAGSEYIGWRWLEPQKGKWVWKDAEIERFRRANIKILGAYSTAPEWASFQQDTVRAGQNGYWDKFFQPKNLDDYANYVTKVTQRYQGKIDAYEVWNEPWYREWLAVGYDAEAGKSNMRLGYRTSQNPQKDYAKMMETAFKAAKAVDPNVKVVGFNSTTMNGSDSRIAGDAWTRGVLENGGLKWADVISYHHYASINNGFAGDEVETGFKTAIGPLLQNGEAPKPVWMSEGQPLLNIARTSGMYRHTLAGENTDIPTRSADGLLRYTTSMLANGVDKIFLYSMHGHGFFGNANTWGVLTLSDNTLHPMGVAFSNAAWHLEGLKFDSRVQLGADVSAMIFSDGKRSVAALSPRGDSSFKVPANTVDLWGNPMDAGAKLGQNMAFVAGDVDAKTLASRLK